MYFTETKDKNVIYYDTEEKIKITINEEKYHGLISIKEPEELKWPEEFKKSLEKPINSKLLRVLAKGVNKVVIIVSDSTRGVPTSKIIPIILKELQSAGVDFKQIVIVIALGVHRPATSREIEEIIGKDYLKKVKIINHDPYNKEELVFLGKTSFGTPIEVNKTVFQADLRINIGKVEPHEFAGFSGGRKSVLPGISSERTIKENHRPEMILKYGSRPGCLKDNSIHKDMIEATKMLGIHFSINFVLNSMGHTIGLFAGNIFDAHQRAVEFIKSFCQVKIKEKPDIVVTTPGPPLNIDFYQSIKPLISLESIMAEKGIIVLYSLCPDGFNSDDMLLPFKGVKSLDEVVSKLMKNYKIQMDHALLLCKILKKNIKIITSSPNLEEQTLNKIYLEYFRNPQEAVNRALDISGKFKPKVLFFPQPQRTLPILV
ncbi:MAG TPA: nickel-dependent lactate racemase [Candidatus Atribacteria bacterium]|nr:nickel-dependent lactate racemase [Candidatus Atribacteria bacterium]